MKLFEFLNSLKGNENIALDDGAQHWYAETLLSEVNDEQYFEQEVYVLDDKVYTFDSEVYMNSPPLLFIEEGVWDGEYFLKCNRI